MRENPTQDPGVAYRSNVLYRYSSGLKLVDFVVASDEIAWYSQD